MSRWRHLLPGLLLALPLGCATEQAVRPGGFDALRGGQPPLGPDAVLMDVAVIERPAGDRYLNGELWECADEHAVPLEQKTVLDDNGFRVGHVIGSTPGKLQALLTSERHCIYHRRQILPAGKSLTLLVGRTVPEARYQIGQEPEVVLERAQACLVAVPTLTRDGHTRLQFTPQFRHGETLPEYEAASDLSGWVLSYGRRNKTYPALAWEVSLAPNEYVLIGAAADNPQAVGYQCFVQDDGEAATQRLLVIRTGRQADLDDEPPAEGTDRLPADAAAAPLALQATWVTARGHRP
jgi:hypothetical protein